MQIPMMKHLIKYRRHLGDNEFEWVNILCDFFDKEEWQLDGYIASRQPFEEYDDNSLEVVATRYELGGNIFGVRVHDRVSGSLKPIFTFDAFLVPVLEFNGRLFEQKEVHYDKKEYDY